MANVVKTNCCYPTSSIVLLAGVLSAAAFFSASAEITVDGSLGGTSGPLDKLDNDYQITEDLGQIRGSNLFHSFGQFNLNTGESATFTGPSPIENILGRITGGSASEIDGTIRSTYPGANLYLMNPAGILFGPNATLDLRGSFHATTADYLKLSDGVRFTAAPVAGAVLTSAPPEAFGFLGQSPASISVGRSALEVPTAETISFVGGDIDIAGGPSGQLAAGSGVISLASLRSPGEAEITNKGVDVDSFSRHGNIKLTENASISVQDTVPGEPGAGSIYIRGGEFVVSDSTLIASTFDGTGGVLDIDVSGNITLQSSSSISSGSTGTGRSPDISLVAGGAIALTESSEVFTTSLSSGDSGDIAVSAGNLDIRAANLLTSSQDGGAAGDLTVHATGAVSISDSAQLGSVAVSRGDAGGVTIQASELVLGNGVLVSSSTFSEGNAGDIDLTVDRLTVADSLILSGALFLTDPLTGGLILSTGHGGDLSITASESISLTGGPLSPPTTTRVDASTFGSGNGGRVLISAPSLSIDNSQIVSSTNFSSGDAGGVKIDVGDLTLNGGGSISSFAGAPGSTGNGGDIVIDALESITIDGNTVLEGVLIPSSILASTLGAGKAGSINITAPLIDIGTGGIDASTGGSGAAGAINLRNVGQLSLRRGGLISAGTSSSGTGGSIEIDADSISISGIDEADGLGSGVETSSVDGGRGGDIVLHGNSIYIGNGGRLLATASSTGNAGSIFVTSGSYLDIDSATIETKAEVSSGGNIDIQAPDRVLLRDSQITSSTQGGTPTDQGGNISIDPVFVVLDSSQIRANAFAGAGGNISIVADFFLASPDSIVDASSQLGIDGSVVIRSAASNNIAGLTSLPITFLDATALLRERCAARANTTRSSFVVAGRGGLPPTPEEPLASVAVATALPDTARSRSGTTEGQAGFPVLLPVALSGHPSVLLGCGH